MNKKGFTLVELLAVIVVLLVIALVAFPSLISSIKKNEEDSYNATIQNITLAAEALNSSYSGTVKQVPVSTLIELGYLSGKQTNPKDNKEMNGCIIVSDGSYYYKDETCDFIYSSSNTVNAGKTWNYNYTGDYQIFITPIDGYYKLETWGAAGGSADSNIGGYGGYSVGNVLLNMGDELFIIVGGQGNSYNGNCTEIVNGDSYNGGGTGSCQAAAYYGSGGGGATHISYKNGLLSTLTSTDLLIVSGGGGGSASDNQNNTTTKGVGGSGGGIIGTTGTISSSTDRAGGGGGSQTGGGETIKAYDSVPESYASNGLGCKASSTYSSGMLVSGGAGYYGGGCGTHGGGGGGSGYIGNSNLSNKHMTCYNCTTSDVTSTKTISTTSSSNIPTSDYVKIGNGYARITYVGNKNN